MKWRSHSGRVPTPRAGRSDSDFFFFFTQAGEGPRWSRWVQASTPNSLGDSNPGPPSPRGKSQPLSLISVRIGGALKPNDSLKESRDALVTHSSTFPHATRIVYRAFDRSPSELGDSLVSEILKSRVH
jgi:hypothetical protein